MTERAVVCDTNVLISAALLKRSTARNAFDKALREAKLLLSAATIEELSSVLQRPKFDKYILPFERFRFLAALVDAATVLELDETISACRDPKDNKFLELAVCGKATCLISGDHDLLVLHPFRGIAIMTPDEFLRYSWV